MTKSKHFRFDFLNIFIFFLFHLFFSFLVHVTNFNVKFVKCQDKVAEIIESERLLFFLIDLFYL